MGQVVGIAVVWFIVEMLLWYLAAQFVSGWLVFFWFIAAAVIGIIVVRKAMSTLNPMAKQMQAGGMLNPAARPPEQTLIKSVAMAIAGLLLLIPGLLSDLFALIVMLPPVQNKVKNMANNYVRNNPQKIMEMMTQRMGGQNPFGGMGGQNPFGAGNPFENKGPFGNSSNQQNPFGNVFRQNTTVDGSAKSVPKDVKKLSKPANDE